MVDTYPSCNGVLYRHNTGIKICVRCGNKIKPTQRPHGTPERIKACRYSKIKQIHEKHPTWTQKQLIEYIPETKYAVQKYWADPLLNQTRQYDGSCIVKVV